ncbi:F0F1 ATP synthase subunit delta [Haloimpatiens lingqiaonensis]|uniref:F0F1 ATP synthase subunit delta n=1 Tax=Haloimpatiens lingqiaonensis TaxID=1380675 RepID=UPI0010FF1DCA|nr:F0F1 ATP synthase subunit delta [Haloimpatiens lingqiaonensis]
MYEYLDRRYALALYEVAESKGKLDEYMNDLQEIVDLIKNNTEFLQVIKHPEITTSKKKKIFINVFKGKIDEDLLSFLLILIEKDRILYLEEKLKEMEKIHLERNNILLAEVTTVIPLNEQEKNNLKEKLNKIYNKEIIFQENLDKRIIGGVHVKIGDDVIDGTIKTKINEIRRRVIK